MAQRNILKKGDPQLEKHCRPVTEFNPRLHTLIDDMRQTLAKATASSSCSKRTSTARTGKRNT